MKKSVVLFSILTIFFLTSTSFSADKITKNHPKYATIEENYLKGLLSDNFGLRVSCAFSLGEMKSEKAIIPLTSVLRESEDEREKIMAALSLVKIGTERSVYVVKQAGIFDSNERVKKMCERFHTAYLIDQNNKKVNKDILYANLKE